MRPTIMTGRTLKKYLAQRQEKSIPLTDDTNMFAPEPLVVTVAELAAENENALATYFNSVVKKDKSLESTAEFSMDEIQAALRGIP